MGDILSPDMQGVLFIIIVFGLVLHIFINKDDDDDDMDFTGGEYVKKQNYIKYEY